MLTSLVWVCIAMVNPYSETLHVNLQLVGEQLTWEMHVSIMYVVGSIFNPNDLSSNLI